MSLFRSEENVQRWCARKRVSVGEVVPLGQLWMLAKAWYQDRLSPEYAGRSVDEAMAVFARSGLTSPFWRA